MSLGVQAGRGRGALGKTLPAVLRLYLGVIVACWGLSALPLVIRGRRLWSASTLWFQAPFADFYSERIPFVHRPQFWTADGPTWNYPAPSVFVFQFFYQFNHRPVGPHFIHYGFMAYAIFAGIVLVIAGVVLARAMAARGVRMGQAALFAAIGLGLCWPVYFGMERGNIELFLDAGVVLGLAAWVRRRWWLAAVLLGVFGTGKIYPLLFLALLLPVRRWKEFVGGIAVAAGLNVFATWWIGPAPAVMAQQQARGVAGGVTDWVTRYSLTYEERLAEVDHSLFGLLKRVDQGHPQHFLALAAGYALIGGLGMLLLFFGRVWKMPRLNQMLVVSLAAVLLPPTSFDYTLMLLLPAWGWMVLLILNERLHGRPDERAWIGLSIGMLCFALLFAPETFLGWHGELYAAQMKTLVLLVLLGVAVASPFADGDVAGNGAAGLVVGQ
jgi:hypothetical protein